jgi:ABC-type sugar transport system ATPase subunit
MVREPQVFLFDEPLSNLDAKLRNQTRIDIKRLQRQLGATAIFVTHGQVEAMTLADKIVVLQDGVVAQIGTPLEVFERPRNQFVAGFMGAPSMNFIDGAVGPGAFPLLVLRNSFSGISREVDEAARSKGPVNGGSSSQ